MAGPPKASQSLEQLSGAAWPSPPSGSTLLINRCHVLRKIPIEQLIPSDLRVLIGQGIGTEHLMPIALSLLEKNAMIECDYFPGDLLSAAMRVEGAYWQKHESERGHLKRIATAAKGKVAAHKESDNRHSQLLQDIDVFLASDS